MRYLVTGGAGFIGSNIVKSLLAKGNKVKVIDNFSTGKRSNIQNLQNDIELIEGDIRSYHIVQQAVSDTDVILHQAALPSVPRSIKDPLTTNEVNITGTINLLEAAVKAGVKRFVYASSSSVYGDNPALPKIESMTPQPLSPYAVSKLAGEQYCRVFSSLYGIETVCLRYFNVFGENQDPDSQYSAVIPKFIKLIKNDMQPVIFGDGEQSRDFTYVGNVVNANILAANSEIKSHITVNCAGHQQTTLNTLTESLNKLLDKKINPIYEPERAGDIKQSFAEISQAKKLLNYTPQIGFQEGLRLTVEHFNNLWN